MNKNRMKAEIIFGIFAVMIVSGCAAVGVPMTFDPRKKLLYAEDLFDKQRRPLPAEPLIEEAIEIYTKKGDEVGLASAYRTYADFLQSPVVKDWEQFYRKKGFADRTVTFDNRYRKALEYWQKAVDLFDKNAVYDKLSNAYFNIGRLYFVIFKDGELACKYYDMSLQAHVKFRENSKDVPVELPGGFSTFKEFIQALKADINKKKN